MLQRASLLALGWIRPTANDRKPARLSLVRLWKNMPLGSPKQLPIRPVEQQTNAAGMPDQRRRPIT